MSLPPGQRVIGDFPRFGVHFADPPPHIAEPAEIRVTGATARSVSLPVAQLGKLKRREFVADFHCVAGWTTQGLHWEGVPFRTFYESLIVPEARPSPGVSYLRFHGADGYRSVLTLDDALDNDVLLADRLNGTPLNGDHGAPVRLLSPKQYGYKSTKHLCCVELHVTEPAEGHVELLRHFGLLLVKGHLRARVSEEERLRYLPAWTAREIGRLIRPFATWAARSGSRS
jgi:DMSO/TMAO reductase YedYZ molybdopterin-dependent catalytic subunit